jgi:hypothetical protein
MDTFRSGVDDLENRMDDFKNEVDDSEIEQESVSALHWGSKTPRLTNERHRSFAEHITDAYVT